MSIPIDMGIASDAQRRKGVWMKFIDDNGDVVQTRLQLDKAQMKTGRQRGLDGSIEWKQFL